MSNKIDEIYKELNNFYIRAVKYLFEFTFYLFLYSLFGSVMKVRDQNCLAVFIGKHDHI